MRRLLNIILFLQRPENYTEFRPTFKVTVGSPGSDVAAEVAAAMAAASLGN